MATLFIGTWIDARQVLIGKPIQETVVEISGKSKQSDAIAGPTGKAMRRVRLFADADCFVTWNDDPTALDDGTDGRPLGAENPESFDIQSGQKIAVIERI